MHDINDCWFQQIRQAIVCVCACLGGGARLGDEVGYKTGCWAVSVCLMLCKTSVLLWVQWQ